jgi:hypothetical protein
MATNVSLTSSPELWNSAYDDIEFTFDFDEIDISAASNPSGTITRITVGTAFAINPPVGSYCFINSGTYAGLWRVLASTSTTVDLDVVYTTNQNTGTLKSLRLPEFSLYKGFDSDEEFPGQLPLTLVTSFTHTFNEDYQLVINLRGLLQRIFRIVEPDITTDYDFSIFNAFRLTWDGEETGVHYVLNSSITTEELNEGYITAGAYLTNVDLPLLWGCGTTFLTRFRDGFPVLEIFNSGVPAVAGFSNAFQMNQFEQGFDIQ